MHILAVTFDLDGLMFNTEDLYDKVLIDFLESRDRRFTNQLKVQLMGLPGLAAAKLLRRSCQLEDSIQEIMEIIEDQILTLLPNQLRPMPGLFELLQSLECAQIPKAIATSSHRKFVDSVLALTDLSQRFQFVLSREDVELGKPNPDIYLKAAEKLGIRPENMMVLEDSVNGSLAAAAAGAITVAIPGHHSAGQDFSHASHIFSSMTDARLINLIQSIGPVESRPKLS